MGMDTGENNISLSDFENPLMGSLYEVWMTTYVRERIGDIFQLSFDEFLDRPRWEIMKLLEVAKRRLAELNRVQGNIVSDDLEKQLKLNL
ncbi:hypothetical protein BIZ83_gp235 [Erwinia phage vB_EamM_ChrisDB]|jgi:hypothetical protein|uniref:hypothetical protein n=1 Tax=Erwinia phage vB_EamM_ChrisDB TaxID=1883371 RepID=UPI00081CA2A0|nr:hypothetical protein BIZ83_gp235 [Erwinia phage vB_EamM_ChrisDB]ANZ48618.1 hypothetical protein CHRISDB_56 [Erwinia phage vB_EamM_ChrisDB]